MSFHINLNQKDWYLKLRILLVQVQKYSIIYFFCSLLLGFIILPHFAVLIPAALCWLIIFKFQLRKMKKESEYNTADLSRALIRQYLSQKGLKNTLATFERQDSDNKKKISKNLLIDMLSIKHLCQLNKQQTVPQNSILQILVAYLNKKYQTRKLIFAKTEPQMFSQTNTDKSKQQMAKQQTVDIPSDKFIKKDRPSTSKPRNKPIIQIQSKPAVKFEKDQLKYIYQKVSKAQTQTKNKVEEVQITAKKDQRAFKVKQVPEKVNPKRAAIEPLKVQDEYYQSFEQEKDVIPQKPPSLPKIQQKIVSLPPSMLKTEQRLVSIPPSLPRFDEPLATLTIQVNPISNIKKEEKVQHQIRSQQHKQPTFLQIKAKLESKIDQQEYKQNPIITVQKPIENTSSEAKKDQILDTKVETKKLNDNNSQQQLNTLPIVLCDQTMVLGLKSKYSTQVNVAMQLQSNLKIKQSIPLQQQVNSRPSRTMMRPLGKNKDSTKLLYEIISKTEQVPPHNTQQAKKEEEPTNQTISQIKSEAKIEQPSKPKQKQQSSKDIKGGSGQVLMAVGKKRKNKEENNQADYPTKFKFDQNFTHQIKKEEVYEYQPFMINKIELEDKCKEKYPTVIFDSEINYKQKGGGIALQKKKPQKIIAAKDAQRLKTLTFQSGPSILPKSWTQGFILSPFQSTPYGLKQLEGGPCGIIAAVQCFFLKHLLYCSKETNFQDGVLRQVCLVAAIADILYKVKSGDKITLAFPPKGASKIDVNNLRVTAIDANTFETAFSGVWANREQYIGQKNLGVAALLFTVILTKGIQAIESEMDNKQNPLIGNHGHCTQQFVNMLLTGKATSNCFDGDKLLDDYKLKGIGQKAQFGFLTIFQTLKYIEVGKNLKNPIFPVWVICKQFHYHVIFAGHHLISSSNNTPKFDIVYFDGLYNCGDRIRLTLEPMSAQQQQQTKLKDLPLIQQVMMTKWGLRKANWNGSTKIL